LLQAHDLGKVYLGALHLFYFCPSLFFKDLATPIFNLMHPISRTVPSAPYWQRLKGTASRDIRRNFEAPSALSKHTPIFFSTIEYFEVLLHHDSIL